MNTLAVGPTTSLSAATTGIGNVVPCRAHVADLVVAVIGTGTISGGTLLIEECYEAQSGDYGGTWSNIAAATVTLTDVSGGKQKLIHIAGSFWDVRPRISSDVTGGGSITVVIFGT